VSFLALSAPRCGDATLLSSFPHDWCNFPHLRGCPEPVLAKASRFARTGKLKKEDDVRVWSNNRRTNVRRWECLLGSHFLVRMSAVFSSLPSFLPSTCCVPGREERSFCQDWLGTDTEKRLFVENGRLRSVHLHEAGQSRRWRVDQRRQRGCGHQHAAVARRWWAERWGAGRHLVCERSLGKLSSFFYDMRAVS
jgi:hypothetical protein